LNVCLYISSVIPSSAGAFLLSMPFITLLISSLVNSLSSGVFIGRVVMTLTCLW
jgi:hypothetical protein